MTDPARFAPPRLLLDTTVGRLARWLRLLGYDVAYLAAPSGQLDMLRKARAESRLIVTRNRALAQRPGVQTLLIHSEQLSQQINEIIESLGKPSEPITPRCGTCNMPLISLPRDAARSRVPPYIWRTHQQFKQCEHCRRVYWQGTHWEAIRKHIEEISSC